MAIGVVRWIEMVSKSCLTKNIRIEGEIVAFTPGRDIYMLALDEVEDGCYLHVHKLRRDIRWAWAKCDLVFMKLTEKDSDFFYNFPSILNSPDIYIKAKRCAFPTHVSPY